MKKHSLKEAELHTCKIDFMSINRTKIWKICNNPDATGEITQRSH